MPRAPLTSVLPRLRGRATQDAWGATVGRSGKTISRWERGLRRPTRGQAIELLLALRDSQRYDVALLEEAAHALNLDPREHGIVAAAPAPPPRAAARDVRAKVDAALLAASESLDVSPRAIRVAVAALLAAIDEAGYTVAELRAMVTPPRA